MSSSSPPEHSDCQAETDVIWRNTAVVLGTGLGFGMSPVVPGTVGSLWGPFLVWGLRSASPNLAIEILLSAAVLIIGVPICGRAAKAFGKEDPGAVVWDELAVFPIVFIGVPLTLHSAIAGFVLFRVFDMTKPPPIKRFERFRGGWGIMLDDVVAAMFACAVLHGYLFAVAKLF